MSAPSHYSEASQKCWDRLEAFVDKYYAPETAVHTPVKTVDGSTEQGSYTPEILGDLLDRWAKSNPEFAFVSGRTAYGSGYHITCPGAEGWPDGEKHTEPADGLTSTTVVWVSEKGHPNFACKRSHCDRGAGHGRKG